MACFYVGDELGQTKRIRWVSTEQSSTETIIERENIKSAMQVMDVKAGMVSKLCFMAEPPTSHNPISRKGSS